MHDGAPFYTQNGLDCCYLDRCLMTGNKIIMENIYIKGKEDNFLSLIIQEKDKRPLSG